MNNSILVIDDEEIMREILETLLTREGYQVRLASTDRLLGGSCEGGVRLADGVLGTLADRLRLLGLPGPIEVKPRVITR